MSDFSQYFRAIELILLKPKKLNGLNRQNNYLLHRMMCTWFRRLCRNAGVRVHSYKLSNIDDIYLRDWAENWYYGQNSYLLLRSFVHIIDFGCELLFHDKFLLKIPSFFPTKSFFLSLLDIGSINSQYIHFTWNKWLWSQ